MDGSNGASTSLWMATAQLPQLAPLTGDNQADVCVIGAGIAGLTTAYLLQRAGKTVVLIEAAGIGAGETGRTTAHFFPPDERYFEIAQRFGVINAALVADSYRQATDTVERLVREEAIDCAFRRLDGYLVSPDARWNTALDKECAFTTALKLDVERVERVPGVEFDSGPALRFARQAQFHPLRYLAGLARAFTGQGGTIRGGTRAHDIDNHPSGQRVRTEHGDVFCTDVVVATNTPFNTGLAVHGKQAGYRTYVVGLRVAKGAVPALLLWDTGDPYFYLRLAGLDDPDHDFLVVGGQDHKTGHDASPAHRYDEIETWTRSRFPMAGAVAYRWSGEVMEPADGLAYCGLAPGEEHVFMITGDSGNGMTHCTAGAMLVSDLVMGRPNPWADLYRPTRKPYHGLSDFVSEQVDTLGQYADWVKGGEVSSAEQIAPGAGALMRDGARLVAVHRRLDGGLDAVSAKCTHLGCAVHWNGEEKSWDCPCHGSRFDSRGAVLHGPANSPLASVAVPGAAAGKRGQGA